MAGFSKTVLRAVLSGVAIAALLTGAGAGAEGIAGLAFHRFARASCGADPGDAAAVAAARTEVESACPCDLASSHRDYVRCAAVVVDAQVGLGNLPPRDRHRPFPCGVEHQASCAASSAAWFSVISASMISPRASPSITFGRL